MKRQIANLGTFFVVLATFMLFAVQSVTYGQTVSIDPATVESPAAGEQLTLNIKITGGMNVAGYQLTVTFDSTALSNASIANADYLPSGAFVASLPSTDTSVGLGATTIGATSDGDGTLATVTFTVVEAKDSTIGLTNVLISDPAAAAIDVTVEGGMVTGPTPEIMELDLDSIERAVIDRFSEAAGTLMIRDGSGALPGPNEPIDFDQPPFITQGLGPDGQVVQYYNFDVQSVVPAPIWVLFREGEDHPVEGQLNIIDVIPGDEGYNDFWAVTKVTVPADYVANSVRSMAGIMEADYATETTDIIVNCPVVPRGSTAMLRVGGGSNALVTGWYKDKVVYYFSFEEKMLSGATVPLSPIYVTFNVNPPAGGPATGFMTEEDGVQTHNVVATIPSDDDYSPLWLVSVYHNADFDAVSDLASAEAANILAAGVAAVNCPVVSVEDMEMPEEPEPIEPEPPVEVTKMFEMELAAGLNMISLPLMPAEPYTASSFAKMIGATIVIRLDTAMQEFVGFTADQEGNGFPIEGGQGYIVNVPGGGMVTFTGTAWSNTMEDAAAAPGVQLSSTGWAFVVSGDLLETEAGVSYTVVAKNHRTGEVATRQVSSEHKEFNTVWADLTRKSVIEAGDTLEVILFDDLGNIVSGPFTHKVGLDDLRNAYLSLPLTVGDVHPASTILGQNFPNPFNPETWIPYQLEKSADVTLQIYDTSGGVVRTLDLGFKGQGFYMTRSTAAYWDGRNNMGEQVASGVYFYSLQTPDFSATRKMMILNSWAATFFPLGAKVEFDAAIRENVQKVTVFDSEGRLVAQLGLGGYARGIESLYFRWEKGKTYRLK